MIVRLFFLFVLFFTYSNSLEIKAEKNQYDFRDFKVYHDKENQKELKDFLKDRSLFKNIEKTNLGIKKYPIWTYGKISNKTQKELNLILSNPRAGIDFLDVYVLKNGKLLKHHVLGDMNLQEKREILYRKSLFKLEILPNEEYEIISKYKSFGSIDINFIVMEEKNFIEFASKESNIFGFVVGFVFLMLILLLYINYAFPSKINIIYFFIIFGSLSIQFSVAGLFYQWGLNPYFNTIISWSFGNVAAGLIGLFPVYYFNLKNILPKTTYLLCFLSTIIFTLSVIFLFYPYKNDLLYLAPIANIIFLIISVILLFVSIKLFLKKVDGYKIYLLGNSLFLVCVVYFIFGLLSIVPTNYLFYLSLSIGSFVNVVFLGLLIVSNLLKMKQEKEKAMDMINEYSKLSTLGQSMINIYHQWKEPLNHIFYSINNIMAAKEFKDPRLDAIIDDGLAQIKNTALQMTNTSKNFLEVYKDKDYKESVDLLNSIQTVLRIFDKQSDDLKVQININMQEIYSLKTNKYLLSNIFMAIFENIFKTFKLRKIKNPILNINVTKENSMFIIKISDNAKGIKEYPINSIFEKDLSNSKSTGLGLFLVKSILTIKLDGDIKAENTNEGACFIIRIKDNN